MVLSVKGNKFYKRIHRLICEAFHGLPQDTNLEVRHLDANRANNKPSNLAWGSRRDNINDCISIGNTLKGEKHPNAAIDTKMVYYIRRLYQLHVRHKDIVRITGLSSSLVCAVYTYRTWKHLP